MSLSLAERMFQKNRSSQEPDSSQQQQTVTDSISDTHQRVFHVLDRILDTIPEEARSHPMAKMLGTFAREGKKDLRRIPEDFIISLSSEIGTAFTWVANGKMSDLNEDNVPNLPAASNSAT